VVIRSLRGQLFDATMNPNEYPGGASLAPIDLVAVLGGILRRWKLITVVTLFALTATYGVLKGLPSLYKSTVEILVFDPQRQMDDNVQKRVSPFVDAVDNVAMNTEIEVIKSKSIALRVATELGLDKDPEFQPRSRLSVFAERLGLARLVGSFSSPQMVGEPDEADVRKLDWAADALLAKLQVERVLFSYVLTISVTSEDPLKAQRLAETIANDYLASQREARQDALQRVAAWLKSRVDDLQSRVLETESSIEKLKAESGITDTGFNNISEQQIAELNAQLVKVRAGVAESQAHLEQARRLIESNGDVQAIPELMASTAVSQLRQQREELIWRIGILTKNLGEHHSQVIAANTQLDGINKQISAEANHVLANIQNAYDIAVRRQQSLEASLEKLTAARGNSATYLKLQQFRRVADADRKLYENYLSQYNEISQRRTLQDATARIIAPASFPGSPSSPRRTLFYALAGILGLGGGLSLAFLREYLQAGIKTGTEVEQSFGYPVVGVIPFVQRRKFRGNNGRDRLIHSLVDAPLSHFSEAVRAMRIGLALSSSDGAAKVILVTSSLPAEGKSTAAMLLAASSATSGQKTVLLDCDLRQQVVSEAFGKTQPGLSEVLRGTAELNDVIDIDPVTNICVIPAGSIVPNPADLLMSRRMHNLIAQLRNQFDYVVIDASPLLPVVDALALATMADKILVIVEWSRTSRANISEVFKMLRPEAARIAGIVLNKVDPKQLSHYGYSRSYHKYRSPDKFGGA
jgi:succinoglycan biosynthesis transport protein ExoP